MRKIFIATLLATLAAGCGETDSLTAPDTGGGTGPGPSVIVDMGTGTGGSYVTGVISITSTTLAAGGSTSLQVSLVVPAGGNALYTESVDVTFSSTCQAQGLATITTPVNTTTGIASSTYAATGCNGNDVITATATVNGQLLTATGSLTVAAASVGSIEFVSATPTNIGLQGTGGAGRSETSTIIFRVVDQSGGPVSGTDVTFTLNTMVGGIMLTPTTATSDAQGQTQTVIQAGTVATTVRVTATVVGSSPPISTQSSQLTITTGIPDADSMSASVFCHNVEAFNLDGVLNAVTARLADRFNNPVPDGTAVTFTTEGGQIAGQCTTTTTANESGVCSINWVSQDPRPLDGRSTILASAIGEESFTDNNGNGVFDDGDTFSDIPEPWNDYNENGMRDAGEPFFDFNNNSIYDMPDGFYNGLLCAHSTLCSPIRDTAGIGSSNVIIMSGSSAVIANDVAGTLAAPGTVTFTVGDARSQPMPSGTTVSITVSNGRTVGPTSYEVPCTAFNGPLSFPFTIDTDGTPSSGLLFLEVKTPGGITTTQSITITD